MTSFPLQHKDKKGEDNSARTLLKKKKKKRLIYSKFFFLYSWNITIGEDVRTVA